MLDFYIESSLHVAFSVYVLICITFFKLNISYDEPVALFGFFGTIVGYNFIKYDELARVKKIVLTPLFRIIIGISIFSFFASFYYFFQLQITTKWIGILVLLITVLYTIPVFPNRNNMRNWSGVKIYLVAIAWVGVTVVLPVINVNLYFSTTIILKCIQQFVFIFVLMLIFEIIDLQFDTKSLETIPQKLGVKKTKLLSYLLILFFLTLEFFKPKITLNQFVITFLIAVVLGLFTYFTNSKRNKYYTSFWVESVPFFWLILLIVFN
uniref:hypothetical protein n=1 Tax=Flavobacterium sp. TaxID=239 RepID=UPI004049ED21